MSSPYAPPEEARAAGLPPLAAEPPLEILEQMTDADALRERLGRSGRHVHFAGPGPHGDVTVELRDGSGGLLRELSMTEAFELLDILGVERV